MRVAVVDSGVNPENPHIGEVAGGIGLGSRGEIQGSVLDELGHGTAVTAAIQEKAPGAEIWPVKVFHGELATTATALARALDWARESEMDVVNLSLGTPLTQSLELLEAAMARALEDGVLVVSPREHRGRRWWPGSFPGAVGVLLDWGCPREEMRIVRSPEGQHLFRASGYPRPVPGVPPHRNLRGISFAAANVTGLLARLLERNPELTSAEAVADSVAGLG